MFVCRQQFKLTLPGQLCQIVDLFGTESIFSILHVEHKFLENFDILWFSVKYSFCFYHWSLKLASQSTLFFEISYFLRPFRQIGRIVNKNLSWDCARRLDVPVHRESLRASAITGEAAVQNRPGVLQTAESRLTKPDGKSSERFVETQLQSWRIFF